MVILDKFPVWGVYVLTVVMVLVAAEIGFRIGIGSNAGILLGANRLCEVRWLADCWA